MAPALTRKDVIETLAGRIVTHREAARTMSPIVSGVREEEDLLLARRWGIEATVLEHGGGHRARTSEGGKLMVNVSTSMLIDAIARRIVAAEELKEHAETDPEGTLTDIRRGGAVIVTAKGIALDCGVLEQVEAEVADRRKQRAKAAQP